MKKYLKRFKRKIKYNRKANNIFLFLFVMFLFMGVGYAYLNATLSITGTGKVTKTTWDVHFENIQPITGSVSPTSAPVISDNTTVSFSATLNEPGDFYSFNIDLVNAGTLDATIGSLDITPVLTTEQQEYFEYKIKYRGDNSLDVQEGDALSHGDTKTIEILFRYKELDNDDLYPDEDVTFDFEVTINYIQGSYNKELSVIKPTYESDESDFRIGDIRWKIRRIILDDHIDPPSGYIESWDVSEGNNGNVMAYLTTNSSDNTMYDLYIQGNGHLYAPEDSSYLFYFFDSAREFVNLNILDTSNVTNMKSMFSLTSNMETLDLSGFDTTNVTDMGGMFSTVDDVPRRLTKIIGIEDFDTSKVTDMHGMFSYQNHLTELDLSNWNTNQVTNMAGMFSTCSGLITLDISSFNTSLVENMSGMFWSCYSLTALDVSNFNTSRVTDMGGMFSGCSSLTTLDVSDFNTNQVTNMYWMFSICSNITTLDLSNFNTSQVTNMSGMFSGCDRLITIITSNNFVTTNVSESSSMFSRCTSLVGGNGTHFNSSIIDKTYARIDRSGTPGYFTSN